MHPLMFGLPVFAVRPARPAPEPPFHLRGHAFRRKTGAELAADFAVLPNNINELKLNLDDIINISNAEGFAVLPANISELKLRLDDIINRSDDELVALGRAFPYVMKITVFYDNPIEHLSLNKLRNNIGSGVMEVYSCLYLNIKESSPRLPKELALLILSYLTGHKNGKEKQGVEYFINNRLQKRGKRQTKDLLVWMD